MNQSDTLYRAFIDYVEQTGESRECALERGAIATANAESDVIEAVHTSCLIEEDWIIAIETGLVFIEKAINEARQFIRTEGSVLPIEKVKRVSRDSIVHLAQHSDLITKEPEDSNNTLTPDELYICERLSDFAVYENRFLCLLLNRLKSFVSIRYNKILELTNEYNGSIVMNKTIVTNKRKTVYELKMTDVRRDDFYLKERNNSEPLISRIDDILKTVMHFINMPLIQEVLKVPPLKPPIIKTNVLKMNQNFKGAAAVYDFITAYDKDGYTIVKSHERINPLTDFTAGEVAQTVMLTSFLVYKNSLKLEGRLKNSYEKEEERRRLEAEQKQKAELAQLKRRIAESGVDPVEYMLLLEKRNKTLELDSSQLAAVKQELEKMQEQNEALKENIESLNIALEKKQAEMEANNQKFAKQVAALNEEHECRIEQIYDTHRAETEQIHRSHEAQADYLTLQHEKELSELKGQLQGGKIKITDLEDRIISEQIEHAQRLDEAQADYLNKVQEYSDEYYKKSREYDRLSEQKTLIEAKLLALRSEYKLIEKSDDFTKKESFGELEHQFKAFKAFFKDEWKKTKKKIRKEVLSPDKAKKTDAADGGKETGAAAGDKEIEKTATSADSNGKEKEEDAPNG